MSSHSQSGVARTINWGNLCLCIVALLMSFGLSLRLLREEATEKRRAFLNIFGGLDGLPAEELPPHHLLTLPYTKEFISIVSGGKYGILNVAYKVRFFFREPLVSPIADAAISRATQSQLYRQVLLKPLFGVGAAVNNLQSVEHVNDPVDDKVHILHLCSATSCVGPFLFSVQPESNSSLSRTRVIVTALVYGEASLSSVVMRSLRRKGVRTVNTSVNGAVGVPQPLHGAWLMMNVGNATAPAASSTDVRATCTDNRCRYMTIDRAIAMRTSFLDLLAKGGEFGEQPQKSATLHSIPTPDELVHWDTVPIVPMDKLSFIDEGYPSEEAVTLVHIDTDAEDSIAVATYLYGLLRHSNVSLHPKNIWLPLYVSPWAAQVIETIGKLREHHGYHVLPLHGECMHYLGNASDRLTAMDLNALSATLSQSLFYGGDAYGRAHAIEPWCSLLLSRYFLSVSALFSGVKPGTTDDEVANFFSPHSTEAMVVSNGGGTSKAAVWTWVGKCRMARLQVILPVCIAVVLCWGLSKRRKRFCRSSAER